MTESLSYKSPRKSESNLSEISETDLTTATELTASDESLSARGVSFGAVHIREYERIVGDHPDTKVGVPLAIGWGYFEREPQFINDYEKERQENKTRRIIRMSSITRKNLLHHVFEIPEEELRSAEKEVQKIRKQRETTVKQTQTETAVKKAGRKLKKIVSMKSIMKGISAASGSMMMPSVTVS